MKELSESHVEKIISLLEKDKPLPEHYKDALISGLRKLKTFFLSISKINFCISYMPRNIAIIAMKNIEKNYKDFKSEIEARPEG